MNIARFSKRLNAEYWNSLKILDKIEADRIKSCGCPFCKGKLHRADYPRKPRGKTGESGKHIRRYSFCCSLCRRRVTPLSYRFAGRKVYSFSIVFIIGVLRSGREKVLQRRLHDEFGMSAVTIRRWFSWWQEIVFHLRFWREYNSSFLMPPVGREYFPASFFERLALPDRSTIDILKYALRAFTPLSLKQSN
jgi:hypothetical protein